jgi:type IV pilus assembly protein PilA
MVARQRQAGFTLVELLIVVAIIGMLAAIAIPGFRQYVAKSKTAEAANQIQKLCAGATAYFYLERLNNAGTALPRQFPVSVTSFETPTDCCSTAGQKCISSTVYENDEAWKALSFSIGDPHYYAPFYSADGTGLAFRAQTFGDLNCNTTYSMFERLGTGTENGEVSLSGAIYSLREWE